MTASSLQSATRRRTFVLAISFALLTANVPMPMHAADSKGLLNRVGKVEECVFGSQHNDKPLHERITELEAQTKGGEQPGPLARRMDALEKAVTGGDAAPKSNVGAAMSAANPARAAKSTKTATKLKPIPTSKSDYMPPIAPQLDLSAKPDAPAETAATNLASTEAKPELDELLQHGTSAFQAGHTDEAEKVFRDVLSKSPFNSNACFNLGAIAETKGDLAGALGNYRTALIGAPNDPQIQEAIAQVEQQIAQKQDSPFHNPVVSTKDGATLLRGNASDYGLKSTASAIPPIPVGAQNTALNAGTQQGNFTAPGRRTGWQTAGVVGGAVLSAAASMAIRQALRGGGGGMFRGGGLGALHCPICRLISF
jgi:hypothetical protein